MKYHSLVFAACLLASAVSFGQDPQNRPATPGAIESESTALEILTRVRRSLGGEENFAGIRSLSISAKNHHRLRNRDAVGDLKIEFLAPDKYQKIEKTSPRPADVLTLKQTVNGDQVWVDRQLQRPSGTDDGSNEFMVRTPGRNSPITSGTSGMRSTTTGTTTVRNEMPGDRGQERTILGMRIPGSDGQGRDNQIERLEQDKIVSANKTPVTNKPPDLNIPDVKSAMERQIRNESICLLLTLLAGNPTTTRLRFAFIGEIDTENGKVYAIDINGPDDFAGSLFIDKASLRPVLFNYREYRYRNTGYVVSAGSDARPGNDRPENVEMIALQLFFTDYRNVDGIQFPHQILKLINGTPVETWEIEKFKLNPNLKPKKFEK